MNYRLLVIDDDEASCRLIKATFQSEGFDVTAAVDGPSGLERVVADRPHVVLLDIQLPGLNGLEVLEQLKTQTPSLPIVMLTASNDIKTALRATKLGAYDYLTKPIDTEEVVAVVRRALDASALRLEVEDLRKRVGHHESDALTSQMGPSSHVKAIVDQVAIVAASTFTVLILGETGTGKELVAQAIHRQSDRRRKPFIALDCGAIPEPLLESELFGHEKGAFTGAERRRPGQFQLAEQGTCFLDEIGNLPLSLQAKLLRALESREVHPVGAERSTAIDIRFIAATNNDIQARARDNLFRADLYFRLAQYTIHLPSLRERREDIPFLTQRFLDEAGVELRRPVQQLLPEAMEVLTQHDWPGNIRELRNVVRQAVLTTNELVIRARDVKAVLSSPQAPPVAGRSFGGQSLQQVASDAAQSAEREAIVDALRRANGNKSQAARELRTDYKTLLRKIRQLQVRAQDFT